MYFVDKENKQGKIRKITVTEGKIYLIRFCDSETKKWAHVMIDEIKNETLSVRTGARYEPITIRLSNIVKVYDGGVIPKVFDGDTDTMNRLYRGEIYSETEKRFIEGGK